MVDHDKIKARLAEKGIGGLAVQEPPAKRPSPLQGAGAPAAPFNKPKPPVIGTETVKAACGHEVPFELFEASKDKFRKERRKKVTDRACAACRERKRQEKEAAAKVRQGQKQHQGKNGTTPGATGSKQLHGRLPDGAKFEVVYDASQTRWTGTLTIGGKVFTDGSSSVFKLLSRLDRQFRESVPAAKEASLP